ncbi:MAG: heparan-alpha-glucosaminide N-acetyltransferase domain-containing protein [Xanthomonadales bacterium]|nr:heparan-alpha-glucosaminide N-acetyltransferase domain-containing protein [Xanthomonadales bacterium]
MQKSNVNTAIQSRIIGFDVARALAIFGMVFVNFKIAMNATTGSDWLLQSVGLLEGRASALFVVLAGIGISLMTRRARASNDSELISQKRNSIIKRGLLLIAVGLAYSPIWPADILHFYGFYFLLAAFLFARTNRALLLAAIFSMLGFVVLLMLFNYETGWNWETLDYLDFWTVEGMFRHIFFNGFHPVFPWFTFVVIGIWLGRLDFNNADIRRRLMIFSFSLWAGVEILSKIIQPLMLQDLPQGVTIEDVGFLFGTGMMPPMPQYIIAVGSLAVFIITLCVSLTQGVKDKLAVTALYRTGQLALSLYLAHVVLGMGLLESIGRLENQSIDFAAASALAFCLAGIVFSYFWVKYLGAGPFERLFRKFV